MARVPKMARGKIPLARGIHCCPKSCLFLLPHRRLYTVQNTCIYTHTYRLYMNYREAFLHRSERCEVLTGYLSLGRRSGGDWTNTGHRAERFTVCFSNRKRQQPSCYLSHFLRRTLLETSYSNYTVNSLCNYNCYIH
jgi:hypothetical protein